MNDSFQPPPGFVLIDSDNHIPFINNFFRFYECLREDGVTIGTLVSPEYCNAGRMAHGGFMLTLGDYATAKATFQVMGRHNRYTLHMNLAMNFFAPAPLDSWLEARARVTRAGKSVVFTTCEFFADGELVGKADAILKSSERKPETSATTGEG